jgi:hypothetical protein
MLYNIICTVAQLCNMCLSIISTVIMDSAIRHSLPPLASWSHWFSWKEIAFQCCPALTWATHRLGTCKCHTESQQLFQHHLGWESARILNSTEESYQRNNSADQSSRVHWHQQLYGPSHCGKVHWQADVVLPFNIAESRGLLEGQACKGSPSIGAGHGSTVVVQGAHWNWDSNVRMQGVHIT